ncbi:probably inactive leucine-rich repeat receptor-like protein kinase IMK2 [Andrographis paniculata]|uniref:probably inactive leucine-rich repeat receptor-like protein kinase IMK2 n=1 Tax=Andrographis paniculata TaxID=175694 RepID=UPI0021E86F38|nr:probably inactive leucine-rich repeat receptor-like protein kinase IMK2 [Andrographis paniculata]
MSANFGVTFGICLVVLLFQCGVPSHAMLNPIDFLALQSIRRSLRDLPGSNYFSAWDFTSDPCKFPGVFCDADRVVALNLGDPRAGSPGLTGRLDPAISKLSALAEFTVVPGRVFGSLPQTLSRLRFLRFLAISRNYLTGEIPATIGQLRGLRTLDLSFNQLAGSIPPSIGTLPALSNLILCHNRLTGSIPPFSSRTLTRMDLKHNDLSGSLPVHGLPPSLQYLSLSWNRLSGPVDRAVSRLNRLNYIDLSLNRFTGPIPACLFTFPISNLQLQRNQFAGTVQPVQPVRIQTVDLSYNTLSGHVSAMFSSVENLYLNNNRFTGEVPRSVVEQLLAGSIRILYLQHNYLTGIVGINPTVQIPLRSSLCLQYNCMVLPLHASSCPLKAGTRKTRPMSQCREWKG